MTQPNPLKTQIFDPFPTQPNPTRGSTQPMDNSELAHNIGLFHVSCLYDAAEAVSTRLKTGAQPVK